jgi:hypothetical protein
MTNLRIAAYGRLLSGNITPDILTLTSGLLALQVLDIIFTATGIATYGLGVEGNPLVRALMLRFGSLQALLLVKSFAVLMILSLMLLSQKVAWVREVLYGLIAVYLCAAVLPWAYLLVV